MDQSKNIGAVESEPVCSGSVKITSAFVLSSEAIVTRFSPDQLLCLVGENNGVIQVFTLDSFNSDSLTLELKVDDENLPCTDMCFVQRPSEKLRLIATYASGFIRFWVLVSKTKKYVLHKFWREPEYSRENSANKSDVFNQILCLSVSYDGKRFVTGGSDMIPKVYDLHSTAPGRSLNPSIRTDPNLAFNFHTNRITAVAYHPRGSKDPTFSHLFISASWDGTIQGWDDRNCGSLWQYHGTNVAGADGICIDAQRNLLISGSFKHDKILGQVWEARSPNSSVKRKISVNLAKPLSEFSQDAGSPNTQIYVARMSADGQTIIFGGTNSNTIKLINTLNLRGIGAISNLPSGVYSADSCIDPDDKKRMLLAITNGMKVYLAIVDSRQTNFNEL